MTEEELLAEIARVGGTPAQADPSPMTEEQLRAEIVAVGGQAEQPGAGERIGAALTDVDLPHYAAGAAFGPVGAAAETAGRIASETATQGLDSPLAQEAAGMVKGAWQGVKDWGGKQWGRATSGDPAQMSAAFRDVATRAGPLAYLAPIAGSETLGEAGQAAKGLGSDVAEMGTGIAETLARGRVDPAHPIKTTGEAMALAGPLARIGPRAPQQSGSGTVSMRAPKPQGPVRRGMEAGAKKLEDYTKYRREAPKVQERAAQAGIGSAEAAEKAAKIGADMARARVPLAQAQQRLGVLKRQIAQQERIGFDKLKGSKQWSDYQALKAEAKSIKEAYKIDKPNIPKDKRAEARGPGDVAKEKAGAAHVRALQESGARPHLRKAGLVKRGPRMSEAKQAQAEARADIGDIKLRQAKAKVGQADAAHEAAGVRSAQAKLDAIKPSPVVEYGVKAAGLAVPGLNAAAPHLSAHMAKALRYMAKAHPLQSAKLAEHAKVSGPMLPEAAAAAIQAAHDELRRTDPAYASAALESE